MLPISRILSRQRTLCRKTILQRVSLSPLLRLGPLVEPNKNDLALRFFSSANDEATNTLDTLDRATRFVVDRHSNPLGTMDTASWDDVITIMSGWLQRDEWKSPTNPGVSGLGSYRVDSAERILQRLIYEKATTNPSSIVRRDRERMVGEWQENILNAWLYVAKEESNSDNEVLLREVARRAEMALERIVAWYNQGGYQYRNDPLPVSSFVALCRLWISIGTVEGCQRSVDLLMAWTEGDNSTSLLEDHKAKLAKCFNEAMKLSIKLIKGEERLGEDFVNLATSLAGRMEELRESGWSDIDDVRQLIQK